MNITIPNVSQLGKDDLRRKICENISKENDNENNKKIRNYTSAILNELTIPQIKEHIK